MWIYTYNERNSTFRHKRVPDLFAHSLNEPINQKREKHWKIKKSLMNKKKKKKRERKKERKKENKKGRIQ